MSKGGALGRSYTRFKCAECEKKFRSRKALSTHVRDMHIGKNVRRLRSLESSKWAGLSSPTNGEM